MVFWSLLNFGSILEHKLNRFIFGFFETQAIPEAMKDSGMGKIRAPSDTVGEKSYFSTEEFDFKGEKCILP